MLFFLRIVCIYVCIHPTYIALYAQCACLFTPMARLVGVRPPGPGNGSIAAAGAASSPKGRPLSKGMAMLLSGARGYLLFSPEALRRVLLLKAAANFTCQTSHANLPRSYFTCQLLMATFRELLHLPTSRASVSRVTSPANISC